MADLEKIDGQDIVSATVAGSVTASTAHQAEREDQVGVPMDLPDASR